MSDRHWFNVVPGLAREHLELIGATLQKPRGVITYALEDDGKIWKTVGFLTVDAKTGAIKICPRNGCDTYDHVVLASAAEDAFRRKPTKATGYTFNVGKKSRWWLTIVVRTVSPDQDGVAAAIREHVRAPEYRNEIVESSLS